MLLGLAACASNGCGNGGSTGGSTPNAGSIVLDMSLAPTNARCAVITVTPQPTGTVVTQSFTLTPEAQSVFTLNNLPIGTVSIAEQVFTVACNATTGATPGWISQAETVSIDPGEPVTLALTLVPNASGGQVSIQNTFVTPMPTFSEFTVSPGNRVDMRGMAPGPDGAVWFDANVGTGRKGDPSTFSVFRIATSGFISTFTSGFGGTPQFGMTAGPDGNLWYTAVFEGSGAIGRVTPTGGFALFSVPVLPTTTTFALPRGITAGSDGNLWFTDVFQNEIGRTTVNGTMTMFPITTGSSGLGTIAAGPDGNIWFTEQSPSRIGRMSKTGSLVEFSTPTANAIPDAIAAGPDGNLWFIEDSPSKIGRISTTGSIVEFTVAAAQSGGLGSIIAGPDGNMWFIDVGNQAIGQITAALGTITEFPIETTDRLTGDLAVGSDGNFYLSEITNIMRYHP